MKRNAKCALSLILCALLVMAAAAPAALAEQDAASEQYTIYEAYEYPITYESPVWSTYTSLSERIEACEVPDGLMEHMTTEALLETVLNYPLLVCIMAFDTIQDGVDSVSSYFGGIEELCGRTDAVDVIDAAYGKAIRQNDIELTEIYLGTLKDYILYGGELDRENLRYTTVTLLTEGLRKVTAYEGMTWSDHSTNLRMQQSIADDYLHEFPNARRVGSPSPKYNCHSYAWWSASENNPYWTDNPSPFMNDGIYEEVRYDDANVAVITYETATGIIMHSARYDSTKNGVVYVTSKWDACAVFSHPIGDCPYAEDEDFYRYQGWAKTGWRSVD